MKQIRTSTDWIRALQLDGEHIEDYIIMQKVISEKKKWKAIESWQWKVIQKVFDNERIFDVYCKSSRAT